MQEFAGGVVQEAKGRMNMMIRLFQMVRNVRLSGRSLNLAALFLVALALLPSSPAKAGSSSQYTIQEIVDAGNDYFGSTSGGLDQRQA